MSFGPIHLNKRSVGINQQSSETLATNQKVIPRGHQCILTRLVSFREVQRLPGRTYKMKPKTWFLYVGIPASCYLPSVDTICNYWKNNNKIILESEIFLILYFFSFIIANNALLVNRHSIVVSTLEIIVISVYTFVNYIVSILNNSFLKVDIKVNESQLKWAYTNNWYFYKNILYNNKWNE